MDTEPSAKSKGDLIYEECVQLENNLPADASVFDRIKIWQSGCDKMWAEMEKLIEAATPNKSLGDEKE